MKSGRDNLPREVLPIPDRSYTGFITYDAKEPEAKFPPIDPLLPPEGAPNPGAPQDRRDPTDAPR
jgi:arylsulfatase